MKRSPFIAYIDETGDHGLESINPTMPVFTLCAALYNIDDYLHHEQPALTDIKFRLWHHDNVVFHSRAIRRRVAPFQALVDEMAKTRLINELNGFFAKSRAVIIAAAIDKPAHKRQYNAPENPYYLATQFVLERIYGQIRTLGGRDAETVCIFESRGNAEDKQVEAWFGDICGGVNQWHCRFPFRCQFASKQTNMAGLQIADLAAYPISRYVERPDAPRPEWLAIEPRIRRSPKGDIMGWGLKVFPHLKKAERPSPLDESPSADRNNSDPFPVGEYRGQK